MKAQEEIMQRMKYNGDKVHFVSIETQAPVDTVTRLQAEVRVPKAETVG